MRKLQAGKKVPIGENARPWRRSLAWLLFLGPFFFASYGLANWWAGQQENVNSIVFGWEKFIPFLPWTIIPYWSIDVLYGISLFICTSKRELDTHALRLLTAQIIAVLCFILFPLTFSFDQPATDGFPGYLFAVLTGFDRPFNQAPSLHIALLVILWVRYLNNVNRNWQWLVHGVGIIIGVSVLTTYQHHFIDIPTGMLLGWFCVWLWPEIGKSPFAQMSLARDLRRYRLSGYYLVGAIILAVLAFNLQGSGLWLLWPAISLLFVASFYVMFGSDGFQKDESGKLSLSTRWLLWPYLLGARINTRLWTRSDTAADHVMDGVWLGRIPSSRDLAEKGYAAIIDLTAEFSAPGVSVPWYTVPNLDLITPPVETLSKIAEWIERFKKDGKVLVVCALGYSRSAMAVVTWLASTQRVGNMQQAIEMVQAVRPRIVIQEHNLPVIESAIELCSGGNKYDEQ